MYFGELSTFVRTVLSGTELCHLAFEGQCSHYFYSVLYDGANDILVYDITKIIQKDHV